MEELDLKELLQIFWEKKLQILLIIAIFAVVGIIYTFGFVTPKYRSSTKLLLATNSSSQTTEAGQITTTDVTLNSKLLSTYTSLVKSKTAIRTVISNLAIDVSEEEIEKNVSVTTESDADVIIISVKNEDPVLAAKITNETAKVFIQKVKEFYGMENVHVVDEAEVAEGPYNINHAKDVIIFSAIGFVIAILYVLIRNMLDTTIKSSDDIEKIGKLTVLVTIPMYENALDTRGKTKNRAKRRGK